MVEWTKLRLETYVGPGFADSGWDEQTIYVTCKLASQEVLNIPAIEKFARKCLSDTEVSRVRFLSAGIVDSFKPEFYHFVYDKNGKWAGC